MVNGPIKIVRLYYYYNVSVTNNSKWCNTIILRFSYKSQQVCVFITKLVRALLIWNLNIFFSHGAIGQQEFTDWSQILHITEVMLTYTFFFFYFLWYIFSTDVCL